MAKPSWTHHISYVALEQVSRGLFLCYLWLVQTILRTTASKLSCQASFEGENRDLEIFRKENRFSALLMDWMINIPLSSQILSLQLCTEGNIPDENTALEQTWGETRPVWNEQPKRHVPNISATLTWYVLRDLLSVWVKERRGAIR